MKKKNKKFTLHPLAATFFILALISSGREALLVCLLCSALHELGHYCAARCFGLRVKRLVVYPFGADMTLTPAIRGYFTDAAVSLSGPIANLMLAAVGYMLKLSEIFVSYNLLLALVNLLPVSGLDGGTVMGCILCRFLDPDGAYRALRFITVAVALAVWVASVYVMLFSYGDPSMFFISTAVLFTSFVKK